MKIKSIIFYGSLVFSKSLGAAIYLIAIGDLAGMKLLQSALDALPR